MDDLSIPIDIQYNKLLDWLIDRRHCDSKWHQQLRQIREKVGRCLSCLPQDCPKDVLELKSFEITDVTYLDCQRVMDYLKTVEPLDTNILGQYTSQRLKEWNDILKTYEKGNVFLAEGAQALTRQVNYEIAALKKQISKCQQQQREFTKRASDCQQSATNHRERFKEKCRELGIEGSDVRSELTHLVTGLPTMFDEVVKVIAETSKGVQYYKAFCYSINKKELSLVPLLSHVIEHGNTTVYQYEHNEPPPSEDYIMHEEEYVKVDSILEDNPTGDGLIDWGNNETPQEEGEIDFGEGEGIDFDISVENVDISTAQIVVEEAGDESHTVSTTAIKYPTILQDLDYRNRLMNDVMEVYEFLNQRDIELTSDESGGGASLMVTTQLPAVLQVNSSDDLVAMVTNVKAVIDKMTDKRLQHLLLIVDSQSYLERLSSQLIHQKQSSDKLFGEIDSYTDKADESNSQQYLLEESMKWRVKRTRQLQQKVAGEISKKYKGRRVNLIGEINQI